MIDYTQAPVEILIDSIANNGFGIGRVDGKAIFVPFSAPGDLLSVRISHDYGRYAEAEIVEVLRPSSDRISPDCPDWQRCGGCCFRHLPYSAELQAKQGFVTDAFSRIGAVQLPILPLIPSPLIDHYRNKAEYAVLEGADGRLEAGFFMRNSQELVASQDCKLQPVEFTLIKEKLCALMNEYGIRAYSRQEKKGLLRHIILRKSSIDGSIMVCLVANAERLPHEQEICSQLSLAFPYVTSIVLNTNTQCGNQVTGLKNRTLFGDGTISDSICGVPVSIDPLSFFQVNPQSAANLYQVAAKLAAPGVDDTLLDMYCGMGTIGLSMAEHCAKLIGCEIVPEAIQSARQSAAVLGARARFICADAEKTAYEIMRSGEHVDIVLLDPPRRGCSKATLTHLAKLRPQRIVMVSCDPATAARDTRILAELGYQAQTIQPVDMFPRTRHVETVVLLTGNESCSINEICKGG